MTNVRIRPSGLALAVMAVASLASGLTSYASELITTTVLLIFIIVVYATR